MDDIVLRGMAKWPNVPAVYGWLSLTRRGQWLIKGDPVAHSGIEAFIARNYEHDGQGCWFFQNGPQRVFVGLDYTPIIYRAFVDTDESLTLQSHVGSKPSGISGAWFDENGTLIVDTECGVGIVHDRDLEYLTSAFVDTRGNRLSEAELDQSLELMQRDQEAGLYMEYCHSTVPVQLVRSKEVPLRFGFDPSPAPREGESECP